MSFAENAARKYCAQADCAENAVRVNAQENGKQNISHVKTVHFGEEVHPTQNIQKLSIANLDCQSAEETISHVKDAE